MRAGCVLAVIGVLLSGACASAQDREVEPRVFRGNDTGGIISWSCENEALAKEIAADHCKRWDKYPRITSVHRQYGDFIAFHCLWSPHVNRYALPEVHTRASCHREYYGPVVKALN